MGRWINLNGNPSWPQNYRFQIYGLHSLLLLLCVPSPDLGRLKQGIREGLQSAMPRDLGSPAGITG
jgi:hypothetical protein